LIDQNRNNSKDFSIFALTMGRAVRLFHPKLENKRKNMPIHPHKETIKKDVEDLVAIGAYAWSGSRALPEGTFHSNMKLKDLRCALGKATKWNILGICFCGARILFTAEAIFKNGKIISVTSKHDNHDCPECEENGIKREVTRYGGVASRVA
jgi:hypothetical protein